jgi:hypothetical protein
MIYARFRGGCSNDDSPPSQKPEMAAHRPPEKPIISCERVGSSTTPVGTGNGKIIFHKLLKNGQKHILVKNFEL